METYLIVDGVIAAQTPKIQEPFCKILPEFNQIVEIGFNRGALSLWLFKNKKPKTKLLCYDIFMSVKEVINDEISFIEGDCFDEKVINDIKNIIQQPGKSLLLCDGGNKVGEFNTYAPFLKPGDVIMCHDYAHSSEDFIKIKNELNWPAGSESDYDSIKNVVEIEGLIPYYYDEFKSVLWGSFTKI